ncbi:MAG TPA: phospholipid carrier-dependent glycosyltransferase [Streptosporangiaceae bacterium]|jgi:dolichyl-phosphate-mannose--protein O-mannosyl transferase|nr:phospholipid carrier-dependent glycosyltransferase [Streptosporangiaceae bacterium]
MRAFGYAPPVEAADSTTHDGPAASLRERLVPPMPPASIWGWAGPLLVTLFGGFLRFYRLGTPHAVVFDETYYVPDAYSILKHGVELNPVDSSKNRDVVDRLLAHGGTHILTNTGEYVVHPPLGKVLIAVGEWIFGLTPFGWRFMVAVIGTLSILLVARIARRMTRSTLLGCIAGLLMSLDGLELVLSRTAILDIFVMFWALAAFGMLVLDRDAARAKLVEAAIASGATGAPGEELAGGGCKLGIRWRRVLAGVFLGFACASKWNGIWFVIAFAAMAIAWDLGARRALGYASRLTGTLRSDAKWLPVTFLVVPFAAYTASWSGWFASHLGYDRNWAALNGNHTPIWSTLDSWYQYQKSMLGFGLGLNTHAGYVSEPWSWLYLGRPVSFFYTAPKGCGASSCSQEVLAIGTPAIWWASILALLFCLGWWISRRDWRAGAVLAGVGAGWLPWFWFALHDNRTEYYFYAVAFLPYLVIAITLCLGLIIGPISAPPGRRAIGAVVVGAYLLLVLANFAYLYPVLTAQVLPYEFWRQRMWFNSWI